MKTLVNPLTVRPHELREGDVMVVTVTCHIMRRSGELAYRLYRCPFPPGDSVDEGVPQGVRILDEGIVAAELFPVVRMAGATPDL